MSFSVNVSGHINEPEDSDSPSAAEVEAQFAVKLHEVLSDPAYGVGIATLYGQHVGTVSLLATPEAVEPGTVHTEDDGTQTL